jgi:hypothetical protein
MLEIGPCDAGGVRVVESGNGFFTERTQHLGQGHSRVSVAVAQVTLSRVLVDRAALLLNYGRA